MGGFCYNGLCFFENAIQYAFQLFGINFMVHNAVNFNVRTAAAFINTQVAGKINALRDIVLFQKLLNILQVALFAFRKTGTSKAYPDFVWLLWRLVEDWNISI